MLFPFLQYSSVHFGSALSSQIEFFLIKEVLLIVFFVGTTFTPFSYCLCVFECLALKGIKVIDFVHFKAHVNIIGRFLSVGAVWVFLRTYPGPTHPPNTGLFRRGGGGGVTGGEWALWVAGMYIQTGNKNNVGFLKNKVGQM